MLFSRKWKIVSETANGKSSPERARPKHPANPFKKPVQISDNEAHANLPTPKKVRAAKQVFRKNIAKGKGHSTWSSRFCHLSTKKTENGGHPIDTHKKSFNETRTNFKTTSLTLSAGSYLVVDSLSTIG